MSRIPAYAFKDEDAYLKSLRPVPSPYLVRGRLSAAARRGEKLFRSKETACAQCHPGANYAVASCTACHVNRGNTCN